MCVDLHTVTGHLYYINPDPYGCVLRFSAIRSISKSSLRTCREIDDDCVLSYAVLCVCRIFHSNTETNLIPDRLETSTDSVVPLCPIDEDTQNDLHRDYCCHFEQKPINLECDHLPLAPSPSLNHITKAIASFWPGLALNIIRIPLRCDVWCGVCEWTNLKLRKLSRMLHIGDENECAQHELL